MTIPLPCTVVWDMEGCQQNFDVLGAAGFSGAYGTVTLTFSASNTSGAVTVPHGLGSAPTGFLFGAMSALSTPISVFATSVTAETMVLEAVAGTSLTGSFVFTWAALY